MIELENVYETEPLVRYKVLYDLLLERDDTVNVSKGDVPTFEQHKAYVDGFGLKGEWYFVIAKGVRVGMVSLTHGNEIGVFIFKEHHRKGYARQAIGALLVRASKRLESRGPVIARINPLNDKSQALFDALGFKKSHIVYELA